MAAHADRSHSGLAGSRALLCGCVDGHAPYLIDHAKQRLAQKRGGAAVHVTLDPSRWDGGGSAATAEPDVLVALDEALTRFTVIHPRQGKAIELRYFAGLTLEEAAQVLGISAPTVLRDLRFAQAWLARDLE